MAEWMREEVYLAGMPTFRLSDLARMRLEVVSLFLLSYLICAALLKVIWNWLAPDFSWMPRIGFKKALALLGVTGLFLYVVLTMISGARELMTPGAWQREGVTYALNDDSSERVRRAALSLLGKSLREYADANNGMFPQSRLGPEIPVDLWTAGAESGFAMPFEYVGGLKIGKGRRIVAYEPPARGQLRFVLFDDGRIEQMDWQSIRDAVQNQREQP